jgi:hypothetical protein
MNEEQKARDRDKRWSQMTDGTRKDLEGKFGKDLYKDISHMTPTEFAAYTDGFASPGSPMDELFRKMADAKSSELMSGSISDLMWKIDHWSDKFDKGIPVEVGSLNSTTIRAATEVKEAVGELKKIIHSAHRVLNWATIALAFFTLALVFATLGLVYVEVHKEERPIPAPVVNVPAPVVQPQIHIDKELLKQLRGG